jgi:hypothetical protein
VGDAITSLPPVQASDQVRQGIAPEDQAAIPNGSVVTLATPEPGPLVVFVAAIAAYFARKTAANRSQIS